MGILRLADINATKRVEHDSGDWIEVRANLAKKDINSILLALPQELTSGGDTFTFQAAIGSAEALFTSLVTGWSLEEPATIESYHALTGDAAAWVDSTLYEHFNSLTLSDDERGKPSTSPAN